MDVVELVAQKRDKSVKAKDIRREGKIPAEFYGPGKSNLSIQMDYQTFRKAYIAAGESTIIDLKVEGEEPLKVLVHEIKFDPVSDEIDHVDFINVRMDKEVHTHIPLEYVGVAPAVKNLAGVLNTSLDEVEVKCLPKYLVHSIQVDVSVLEDFHMALHIRDIVVPEGITIVNDPELTLASVMAPREEEAAAEAPAAVEAAAIEAANAAAAATAAEAESK